MVKERGNQAVKNQKYEEAILHYTQAIKMAPLNFTLYSNRSFAFSKVHQYYLAMEDANETIKLSPDWPKVRLIVGLSDTRNVIFRGIFGKGRYNLQLGILRVLVNHTGRP